jgi:hypothetical protein
MRGSTISHSSLLWTSIDSSENRSVSQRSFWYIDKKMLKCFLEAQHWKMREWNWNKLVSSKPLTKLINDTDYVFCFVPQRSKSFSNQVYRKIIQRQCTHDTSFFHYHWSEYLLQRADQPMNDNRLSNAIPICVSMIAVLFEDTMEGETQRLSTLVALVLR